MKPLNKFLLRYLIVFFSLELLLSIFIYAGPVNAYRLAFDELAVTQMISDGCPKGGAFLGTYAVDGQIYQVNNGYCKRVIQKGMFPITYVKNHPNIHNEAKDPRGEIIFWFFGIMVVSFFIAFQTKGRTLYGGVSK